MTVCMLCGGETAGWTIIKTGAPENPDLGIECRRCSALPVAEQRRLRDQAMARDLRRAVEASESAATMEREGTPPRKSLGLVDDRE